MPASKKRAASPYPAITASPTSSTQSSTVSYNTPPSSPTVIGSTEAGVGQDDSPHPPTKRQKRHHQSGGTQSALGVDRISHIPIELLKDIASYLPIGAIRAFSSVSRGVRAATSEFIHRDTHIEVDRNNQIFSNTTSLPLDGIINFNSIRNLEVVQTYTRSSNKKSSRCRSGQRQTQNKEIDLQWVLDRIPHNRLISLSYSTQVWGEAVPNISITELLGRQCYIQRLSLPAYLLRFQDTMPLPELTELAISNIRDEDDLDNIVRLLGRSSQTLRKLTLKSELSLGSPDFIAGRLEDFYEQAGEGDALSASSCLETVAAFISLPGLKDLRIEGFCRPDILLTALCPELTTIAQLRSLHLIRCPGSQILVRSLSKQSLKQLHLISCSIPKASSILEECKGLESIAIDEFDDDLDPLLPNAITKHKHILKFLWIGGEPEDFSEFFTRAGPYSVPDSVDLSRFTELQHLSIPIGSHYGQNFDITLNKVRSMSLPSSLKTLRLSFWRGKRARRPTRGRLSLESQAMADSLSKNLLSTSPNDIPSLNLLVLNGLSAEVNNQIGTEYLFTKWVKRTTSPGQENVLYGFEPPHATTLKEIRHNYGHIELCEIDRIDSSLLS